MAVNAYTVSNMLDSINKTMDPIGGKVELKRSAGNGVMMNTSQSEVKALDSMSKIKSAGEMIQHYSKEEKKKWIQDQKKIGNELYKQGKFKESCEVYLQAMAGLDFGESKEEKLEMQQRFQVPITCNVAAALVQLKQWNKVVLICTQVLILDNKCITALRRRGLAYRQQQEFKLAKLDFETALDLCSNDKDIAEIKKQLGMTRQKRVSHAKDTKLLRSNLQRGIGGLYADKDSFISPCEEIKPNTWWCYVKQTVEWILSFCVGARKEKQSGYKLE